MAAGTSGELTTPVKIVSARALFDRISAWKFLCDFLPERSEISSPTLSTRMILLGAGDSIKGYSAWSSR